MNYLIAGCAGFIASRVAEKLLYQGHRVIGVDDLNNYYDIRLKEWRLKKLQSSEAFTFFRENVADYPAMERLFRNYKLDAVLNLAARAGVRASVEDPWTYYDTNVTGTLNLLECARQQDINKFVLASTSSVYGNTPTPFKVKNYTDTPLSPYAASKKAAETLCHTYHYLYGLDISIPRYFTVYGPAGRPDMSYFRFILTIERGQPIDIYGDGKQARDFTYIDDVAEATIRSLELPGYNIFNVGNDRPIELLKMIRILEELLGKKADLNFLPRHPADNLITWADLTETGALLKWKPAVRIEEGLEKVVKWYFENKQWLQNIKI